MSIPVRGKDNWIATIITWMFFQNIVADNCKCMHIYVRDIQCPFYTNHANSFLFLFMSADNDKIDIHKLLIPKRSCIKLMILMYEGKATWKNMSTINFMNIIFNELITAQFCLCK